MILSPVVNQNSKSDFASRNRIKMLNYSVPSLRTQTAECGDGKNIGQGNSEHLRLSPDVESESLRHSRIFKLGEKGSGTRPLRALQDYNVLREQCLKTRSKTGELKLFEDPEFPAIQSSIYGSDQTKKAVVWKRPGEIAKPKEPRFFVEGASRFDVNQNQIGDCYFLAAMANLAMDKKLFDQVVPEGQSFCKKKYAGIFHFRFWQYGRWVDVVIDDRLPLMDDSVTLLGASSATDNEFWSALLEKAYAKLHGSYKAIHAGYSGEAMTDFTGGLSVYYLHPFPGDLFEILLRAHKKDALLDCGFKKIEDGAEAKMKGLITNHAYSITKVKLLPKGTKNKREIRLVRVRNPHGGDGEWSGAWSDKWPGWKFIPEKTKRELKFKVADDGEFWMSFEDFENHLEDLDICYLNPHSLVEHPIKEKWKTSVSEGEWVSGATAGGFTNMEMFQHNPQYHMILKEGCTVIVELMQKKRRIQGNKFSNIGFTMFYCKKKVPSTEIPKPLDSDCFESDSLEWEWETQSMNFMQIRQVSQQGKLPAGSHFIIPSTLEPGQDGEFMLRVFSEKPHMIGEYDEELSVDEVDNSETNKDQNEELRDEFWLISGDNRELDCSKLNEKLNRAITDSGLQCSWSHCISEDACRRMVALLDVDQSGKLSIAEFRTHWKDIENLIDAFKKTLRTGDGVQYLSTFYLRKALKKAGLDVNNHILGRLVRRYGTKDKKMTLDNFIMCALRVKNMLGTFKNHQDPFKSNVAKFTLDEWIANNLYL